MYHQKLLSYFLYKLYVWIYKNLLKDFSSLLSQNFLIIRLITILFLKEEDSINENDIKNKVKKIRNSIAHNNFSLNSNGFIFYKRPKQSNEESLEISFEMSYSELQFFVHQVEQIFFKKGIS